MRRSIRFKRPRKTRRPRVYVIRKLHASNLMGSHGTDLVPNYGMTVSHAEKERKRLRQRKERPKSEYKGLKNLRQRRDWNKVSKRMYLGGSHIRAGTVARRGTQVKPRILTGKVRRLGPTIRNI